MQRRTIKPADLERVAQIAAAKRVSLGLDAVPAEDIEFAERRAQAAEAAKRRKRRKGAPPADREHVVTPPEANAEFNERVQVGSMRVDARVYWTLMAQPMGEVFAWEVFLSCEAKGGTYYVSEAEVGAERERGAAYLRLLEAVGKLANKNSTLG